MPSRALGLLVALSLVLAAGAVGAQPGGAERATLRSIPRPMPQAAWSAELRASWATAERLLRDRLPRPPRGNSAAFTRWSHQRFAQWLRRRSDAIAELDRALVPIAERRDAEMLVAAAIRGVVGEDMAESVFRVPSPAPIAADEALDRVFRTTLAEQTRPLFGQADAAYEVCARRELAAPPAGVDVEPLRAFCAARRDAVAARVSEIDVLVANEEARRRTARE